jgi:hypothetical protein
VQECPRLRRVVRLLSSERRTVAHLPSGQALLARRPSGDAIVLQTVRVETALPTVFLVEAALHFQHLRFQALDLSVSAPFILIQRCHWLPVVFAMILTESPSLLLFALLS